MGAYVRGVTLIAFIDAAGIGVAMLLLGVPMALPLTAIVFLGGFIPVVGATITGILAVLVAFVTNGIGTALAVAAAVIVVQQLEGNILQPAIMGKAVKLHPLVIILALAIGGIQAGIIGAVLAVPVAAVIWTTVKSWNADTPTRHSETEQKGKPKTLRVKVRRRRMPHTPGRGTRCPVRRVRSPGVPAGRGKAGADGAVR
jgi:predicted PurR-regulated permease PerM